MKIFLVAPRRYVLVVFIIISVLQGGLTAKCTQGTYSSALSRCISPDSGLEKLDSENQTNSYSTNNWSSVASRDPTNSSVLSNKFLSSKSLESTKLEDVANIESSSTKSQNVSVELEHLSITASASIQRKDESNISKIIDILVPFTCVILMASVVFIGCKLRQRYQWCNRQPGLSKCLTLCDSCFPSHYVFQDGNKHPNQASCAVREPATLVRPLYHPMSCLSQVSTTSASTTSGHHGRTPTSSGQIYKPLRSSNSSISSSVTAQNSSRNASNSGGSITTVRNNAKYPPSSSGNTLSVHRNSRVFNIGRQNMIVRHAQASGNSLVRSDPTLTGSFLTPLYEDGNFQLKSEKL